jgi:hypothetical protein
VPLLLLWAVTVTVSGYPAVEKKKKYSLFYLTRPPYTTA